MTTEAGGISVHAVDVASGRPASGLRVRIWRLTADGRTLLAEGVCTPAGVLDAPCVHGEGVQAGTYEAEFDIGPFYRAAGVALPEPAFLEMGIYRFGIAAPSEHFHLPLKFTAWGFSLFRGGL